MQWNIDQNKNVFIHENAFEIVVCQNGCHFVKGGDELNEPLPYVIPDYVRTNKVNINNGVLFPVLQSSPAMISTICILMCGRMLQ